MTYLSTKNKTITMFVRDFENPLFMAQKHESIKRFTCILRQFFLR